MHQSITLQNSPMGQKDTNRLAIKNPEQTARNENYISDFSSGRALHAEVISNKEIVIQENNQQQENQIPICSIRNILDGGQQFNNNSDQNNLQIVIINRIRIRFKRIINDLQCRKIKLLGLSQFKMINDWSSSFKYFNNVKKKLQKSQFHQRIGQLKKQIILKMQNLSKKYPPLDPGHIFCSIFDIISLIISLILIFQYSMQMGFQQNLEGSIFFQIVLNIGLITFFFQILLNFNVGYYNKDEVVKDRLKIFENYKTTLIWDLLSMLGILYNIFDSSHSLVTYIFESFFLIKLLSIRQQEKKLKDLLIYKYGQPPQYILIKMFFKVLWYCHWIAILWHIVNIYEINEMGEENTWLQQVEIIEQEWHIRYIYSFYWAISTIVTGGSMPSTFIEIMVLTILIIPTAILFAYIINEVGQIINQINEDNKEFYKDLDIMNQYMRSKNVGQSLQKRIVFYLENAYLNQAENANDKAQKILEKFPSNIKEDLNKEICFKILNSNKIFNQNFSQKTIENCMKIVEEQHFMPGDIIVSMNSYQDNSLFMIIKGSVEIGLEMNKHDRDIIFAQVPKNCCFGIQSFFSGLAQNFYAKSLTFTTIYKIKRTDFYKMIKNDQNPTDFETFCMIRDQFITTNMCPKVYDQCKLCGKKNDHNDIICNLVHYHPYKRKRLNVIKKQICGIQQRKYQKRKKRIRYHVLKSLKILHSSLDKLLNDEDIVNAIDQLYYDDNDNLSINSQESEILEHANYNKIQQSIKRLSKLSINNSINSPFDQLQLQQYDQQQQYILKLIPEQQEKKPGKQKDNELIKFDESVSQENLQTQFQQQQQQQPLQNDQEIEIEKELQPNDYKMSKKLSFSKNLYEINSKQIKSYQPSQFKSQLVASINPLELQQRTSIKQDSIDLNNLNKSERIKDQQQLEVEVEKQPIDNFDKKKSFVTFYPQFNLSTIIRKLYDSKKAIYLKSNQIRRAKQSIKRKTNLIHIQDDNSAKTKRKHKSYFEPTNKK